MKTTMNYVFNRLEITCRSENQMAFIKELLFTTDKDGNQVFTMERFLPKPTTGNQAYIEEWCRSVWGTMNDAHDCFITQECDSLSIQYATDWRSNRPWVDNLLRYLQGWYLFACPENECLELFIKYKYFELALDKGNSVFWTPREIVMDTTYKQWKEFMSCVDFDTMYELLTKKKALRTIYGNHTYYDYHINRLERNIPVEFQYEEVEYDDLPF